MARIQQSIEIGVPVQVAYNQLTQFEDYPQFMQDVETVQQLDDTHLHWTTRMSNRSVEWDAEIVEQEPDRCIAWRNVSGPTNAGKVEVQPLGDETARVTLTLEAEPERVPGSMDGYGETEMAQRLQQDLARIKQYLESRGAASGAWRGEVHDREVTMRDRDTAKQPGGEALGTAIGDQPGGQATETPHQAGATAPQPSAAAKTSSYAAGSEGWDGNEDPGEPVISSTRNAAGGKPSDSAAGTQSQQQSAPSPESTAGKQTSQATTSEYTLSRPTDKETQDGRYSVAEEQNFDQQSDAARRVGQVPQDIGAAGLTGADPADAMSQSLQQETDVENGKENADKGKVNDDRDGTTKLKQSVQRSIPPS